MKKGKRLLTMLLAIVFMFSFTIQPAFAATAGTAYDLYTNEESETLYIDGTSYTYNYYYENGSRTIDIINNESGHIDKIVYNEENKTIYLNENQLAVIGNTVSTLDSGFTDAWESLGTSSHYISWAESTTTAVIAGMIAIYLGSLGTAGVIAAMGVGALGIIAANANGGTITAELQWYHSLFYTQYIYTWSFEASTGDTYGPYISHVSF